MRRFLVLTLVVGSVVLLAAPAHAIHYYLKMWTANGTTYVETECPAGRTLTITRGGIKQSMRVPRTRIAFKAPKLSRVARAKGKVSAICTPASQGHTELELAFTGVTTGQQLGAGLALLGVGTMLLLVSSSSGGRTDGGKSRRRLGTGLPGGP